MRLLAWTDYPFEALGDTPRQPAPIRRAEVIASDGDVYVWAVVASRLFLVKRWYFYQQPARPSYAEDNERVRHRWLKGWRFRLFGRLTKRRFWFMIHQKIEPHAPPPEEE